jgi:pimeloyl-ACP methyl ester carboxylesterase
MAVIFVHGVPETTAIWDPLLAELGRDDAVTLSPPGFGAPVPDGFGATCDDYLAWLTAEVEKLGGAPHDLVGHDWGGILVARLAAARPDLVRSLSMDIAGTLDPDYVWHDLAQVWQTEGAGEDFVGGMFSGPPEPRTEALVQAGMTEAAARASAENLGPETGQCVLALYRSARQPAMATFGQQLEAAERRPSLVIAATEDPYNGGPGLAHRTAQRLGAQEAVLDGLSHWWMLHDPAQGARVIRDFLGALPA